ncbi:hypothetical protein TW95_gp0997 [Pandoravirus inopinatum]|uniref:Uncharacterized protein n=1 Tax=Pandoravirus inopinatum TaxID=1605721 RepID=A0A0B5JA29_9VIRU|nr:hypothetical protein TW95_gp0997 [Pandoravirus inopinatum]AJF97731.1 hypothetical protein [Pandoravirus inopinatum]
MRSQDAMRRPALFACPPKNKSRVLLSFLFCFCRPNNKKRRMPPRQGLGAKKKSSVVSGKKRKSHQIQTNLCRQEATFCFVFVISNLSGKNTFALFGVLLGE